MSEKARKDTKAMAGIQEGAARSMLAKDAQSQKLLSGAKSLGNSEMQRKLDGKNAKRDEMLAFLCKRLDTMRNVQLREVEQGTKRAMTEVKGRVLGDPSKKENFESNPLKWRVPADLYEQAAQALCRGDLHRGAQLVEKGIAAEQNCFHKVSAHIDLSDIDTGQGAVPEEAMETQPGETCGECAEPEGIDVADAIQRCESEAPQMSVLKRIGGDGGGFVEEEEEEEEEGKGGGGGKK